MKNARLVALSALLGIMACSGSPAFSQVWSVHNDHQQTFTIYVSPMNNPNSLATLKLRPGDRGDIPLGADPHVASALSGGRHYGLEPTNLRGKRTQLSTIWTPKRRQNRTTIYDYMNQEGFNRDRDFGGRLESSIWTTTYRSPNGEVTTDLKFAGSSGSYYGGRGRLSNVTYAKENGVDVIRGDWMFDRRVQGRFEFYLNNRNLFTSSRDGRDRRWWGRRAENP